jgi:branched-subunit amino acid aminotransferase/4-amino-4-deoxychorismate lyase
MEHDLNTNRSFLYGDGFFETFKLIKGKCERFALHFERIKHSFDLLQLEWNPEWNQAFFEKKLNQESKNFKEAVLKARLIFYRNSVGTYTPEHDTAEYYIKLEPFVVSSKSVLNAGIYPHAKKACNFLSGIKSTSALMFVMAGKFMKQKEWDEIIILNEHGRVCEALTSNVFVEIGGVYYTPPLSEGCIDGVNRKAILMDTKRYKVVEKVLKPGDLLKGKLYFSNAVRGLIEGKLIET